MGGVGGDVAGVLGKDRGEGNGGCSQDTLYASNKKMFKGESNFGS